MMAISIIPYQLFSFGKGAEGDDGQAEGEETLHLLQIKMIVEKMAYICEQKKSLMLDPPLALILYTITDNVS